MLRDWTGLLVAECAFVKNRIIDFSRDRIVDARGKGTPLYNPYRYVQPRLRVWFLGLSVLKMGIDSAHVDLKSGVVFERITRAYERSYRFNSKLMRTK